MSRREAAIVREFWVTFPPPDDAGARGAEVVLVLDGSAGEPHWNRIGSLARELVERLPPELPCTISFLGSPVARPAADLRHLTQWYRENQQRVRLIGPVFDRVKVGLGTSVLVLAAGRVFDLEDWLDTPVGQRAIFVQVGEAALTADPRCKPEPLSEVLKERLGTRLDRRPDRLRLPCRHAMPFSWDNPGYQWEDQALVTETIRSAAVRVGLLAASADAIRPEAWRAGQASEPVRWEPCEAPPEPAWHDLRPEEMAFFRKYVARQAARCPVCGRSDHPDHGVRCPHVKGGYVRGQPIYQLADPESREEVSTGYVLLRDFGSSVRWRHHRCPALRLPGDAVALRSGSAVTVYAFDAAGGEWRPDPAQGFRPYYPLGDDTYAIRP